MKLKKILEFFSSDQLISRKSIPLNIMIGGTEVQIKQPLGGYHKPGVTKAGRISLVGFLENRKVKVSAAFSPSQVELQRAIRLIDFKNCRFPEILAYDKNFIVEEWIEGESFLNASKDEIYKISADVLFFLNQCFQNKTVVELALSHRNSFSYIDDYLIPRLGKWIYFSPIKDFFEQWQAEYLNLKNVLPEVLSHPDLTLSNLVKEKKTGYLYFIDNELLGVGIGGILDWHNSFLGKYDFETPLLHKEVPNNFLLNTWQLRKIGSSLDAGNFNQAVCLARQFRVKE